MGLKDDIAQYVDAALLHAMGIETQTGTVVTSPSQVSTDPLTVVFDGSAVAVPVKQFRGFPVFPGMRVGLVKMGTDWVVIGAFTESGTATNTMRMTVGADTPPELKLYGIEVAFLFYNTDQFTGLEVGYFFIGLSNKLDLGGNHKVLLFGAVKYPTPGDPSSPVMGDVNTAHQIDLDGTTAFKDFPVYNHPSVPFVVFDSPAVYLRSANNFYGKGNGTPTNHIFDDDTTVWLDGEVRYGNNGGVLSGSAGRGLVHHVWVNTGSAGVAGGGGAAVVQMTFTFRSGRAYRVEAFGGLNSTDRGNFQLRNGTTHLTTMWWDFLWTPGVPAPAIARMRDNGYLRRTAVGDVSRTFNLSLFAGPAGASHYADATHPRGLSIFDVGDAADYTYAFDVT